MLRCTSRRSSLRFASFGHMGGILVEDRNSKVLGAIVVGHAAAVPAEWTPQLDRVVYKPMHRSWLPGNKLRSSLPVELVHTSFFRAGHVPEAYTGVKHHFDLALLLPHTDKVQTVLDELRAAVVADGFADVVYGAGVVVQSPKGLQWGLVSHVSGGTFRLLGVGFPGMSGSPIVCSSTQRMAGMYMSRASHPVDLHDASTLRRLRYAADYVRPKDAERVAAKEPKSDRPPRACPMDVEPHVGILAAHARRFLGIDQLATRAEMNQKFDRWTRSSMRCRRTLPSCGRIMTRR
jgi:hypothetical protein